MELPGGIPPDRDSSYSCQPHQQQQQQSSNLHTSSSSGQHSLSSSIGISIQQQPQPQQHHQPQPVFERLSRPMSFDKVIYKIAKHISIYNLNEQKTFRCSFSDGKFSSRNARS